MDINKEIVKALLEKDYTGAKESVFKSLYAKASLALDEVRFDVANGVFNTVEEEAELDEMAQTAERSREMRKVIKSRTATAAKRADDAREADFYGQDNSREAARADHADRLVAQAKNRNAREKASKKLYGKGGKVVKEDTTQLDEVSPPDMEKMTGSKKVKASFAKQYGKRGKSVMYATAWKLHNKKAQD